MTDTSVDEVGVEGAGVAGDDAGSTAPIERRGAMIAFDTAFEPQTAHVT
jgi:hypothetical protein